MKKSRLLILVLALGFLSCTGTLWAQETSQPGAGLPTDYPWVKSRFGADASKNERPARICLEVTFAGDADFTPEQKVLMTQSLDTVLAAPEQHSWLLVRRLPDGLFEPGLEPDWRYRITIGGSMAQMELAARLVGETSPEESPAARISGRVDPYFRNAYGGLWLELKKDLAKNVHPVREFAAILIRAKADTRVIIKGEVDTVVGPEGGFYTALQVPSNLEITARNHYFQDVQTRQYVEGQQTIDLIQSPKSPVFLGLHLQWLAYPGITLSVAPADWWELGMYSECYLTSFLPAKPGSSDLELFRNFQRLDLGLESTVWTDRSSADIRVGFALGGGIHLDAQNGMHLDENLPFSFQAGIPLELNLGSGFRLDFQLQPTFTYARDPAMVLYALSLYENSGYDGTSSLLNISAVLGNLIFEPLHFRLGLRWQP